MNPIPATETVKGTPTRGGLVIVLCTYCNTPFHRYRSQILNKKGEMRKIFKCPNCRKADPKIRFWQKVDKTSSPNGCWLWIGSLNADGYGNFPWEEIKEYRAHRIAWLLTNGPIPDGVYVLHKQTCTSRKCINPEHLYLGDQFDNMKDALEQGTFSHQKGTLNANSLLNEDAVREIRKEYRRGNVAFLAKKFGVSIATIRDVHKGRSWQHVT